MIDLILAGKFAILAGGQRSNGLGIGTELEQVSTNVLLDSIMESLRE